MKLESMLRDDGGRVITLTLSAAEEQDASLKALLDDLHHVWDGLRIIQYIQRDDATRRRRDSYYWNDVLRSLLKILPGLDDIRTQLEDIGQRARDEFND